MMAGHHPSEKDSISEHKAPSFTAVNGRESLPNGTSGRNEFNGKAGNETMDRRQQQGGSHSTSRPHSPRPGQDVSHGETPDGKQQHSSPPEMNSPVSSPRKRKRSLTEDGSGSSGNTHYDLSPPRREAGSPVGLVDSRNQKEQDSDRNPALHINGSNGVDSHNLRGHDSHWQADRHSLSGYQSNGHHVDASDAQLAEVLQRETQSQSSQRTWAAEGHPDDDAAEQYGTYGADRASQGAVQTGHKRKRVFSNRTKTGCMTCRKRKKKCDEAHPYCEYLKATTLVHPF